MEEIIKINILEVASELAHREIEKYFDCKVEDIYEWVSDEESKYTDKAQDLFNGFYDYYFNFLTNIKYED